MKMSRSLILLLAMASLLAACSTEAPTTIEGKYAKALLHMEKGEYGMAQPILTEIMKESPGTKYANYAYLHMGNSQLEAATDPTGFITAEVNFQAFLRQNPNHHLVPYVFSRLIELHYRKNVSQLFGEEYGYARDPGHYREIIREYQRFYLLYPNSRYLEHSKFYRDRAYEALAEHEILIGTYYLEQGHLDSAISRFRFTLEKYPAYQNKEKVIKLLAEAYKKNQQPQLAEEVMNLESQSVLLNTTPPAPGATP